MELLHINHSIRWLSPLHSALRFHGNSFNLANDASYIILYVHFNVSINSLFVIFLLQAVSIQRTYLDTIFFPTL